MKILHILSTNKLAGAEKVAIDIIKMFKEENEMYYCSPKGPIEKTLKDENINFVELKKLTLKNIREVVKLIQPDIIHAHDYTTSFYCSISHINVPVISHLHHNNSWISKINTKSILYMLGLKNIETVLGVSDAIYNEFIFNKKLKSKFQTIGNPINSSEIIEKSNEYEIQETYDLVFVGRLTYVKNPINFIEIVKELTTKKSDIKAVLIGEGNLYEICLMKIKELKLEKNIKMVNFVNNPYPIIKNSKVLISTSMWEGFGLAIAEATVLGKPVVARNVGGINEIIDESCGKLCQSNDDFINEIIKLLSNKNYYNTKSDNSRKRGCAVDNHFEYKNKLKMIYSTYQ